MTYEVHLGAVTPVTTAVIRTRVAQRDLSRAIPAMCGEVWKFARDSQLANPGRHVAVYFDNEITVECGVEVGQPFTGNDRIVCSSTPAGLAAWTTHVGPYGALAEAHRAVRDWCAAQGHQLGTTSWEVYGHMADPNAQPRTDVYYLVRH